MTATVRPIRAVKTAAEAALADTYAAAKALLPGLPAAREQAFRRFEAQGLPHRRVEAWKYTDLRALMRDAKPLAAPPGAEAKARAKQGGAIFASVEARRLVFVDGAFVPELSDLSAEAGLSIMPMAQALASGDALVAQHVGQVLDIDDPAVALNTALMGDGIVIKVAAGTTVARPVMIVFAHSGERPVSVFTRSLVVVEPKAKLTLVETHEGAADDQINAVMELIVGDDAEVDHLKIAANRKGALQIATLIASIGARAKFNDLTGATGGSVTRNQIFARLAGENAVCHFSGANLLQGHQHVDTTLVVEHVRPGCESRELYKSVLDGESRGVFQGRITVQAEAQKTDARMATHALLLSENAEADAKPELEIFADDVQCGHGATAGALDEDLLFYLKARGIPPKEAEALMVTAFVGEVVEQVAHEGLRDSLLAAADGWLQARSA